jgi:hypothetical protein
MEEVKQAKRLQIEMERSGKKFYMVFEEGCSIGELYDATFEILKTVVEMANEVAKKADPNKKE